MTPTPRQMAIACMVKIGTDDGESDKSAAFIRGLAIFLAHLGQYNATAAFTDALNEMKRRSKMPVDGLESNVESD